MKKINLLSLLAIALFAVAFTGCKKETPLPPIGGYNSADEVGSADLVAYWSLNGDGKESVSGDMPTSSSNVTWVDGQKGKAANFNIGYLLYGAMDNLGTNLNDGFTVSAWVKLTNNQNTTNAASVVFSLARANEWAGSINMMSETAWYPSTSDSVIFKGLIVSNSDLGWQDSRNTIKVSEADAAAGQIAFPNKVGGTWAQMVITWDNTTKLFKVYSNGVKISNPVWENRDATGTKDFVVTTPCHPVLGALETFATGVTTDSWNKGLVGSIDEVRVWKRALSGADIGYLYQLELAGR